MAKGLSLFHRKSYPRTPPSSLRTPMSPFLAGGGGVGLHAL
jgi:hypothetical protein